MSAKLKSASTPILFDPVYRKYILENLRYIRDLYPYVEIAKNPPSKPAGYFKTWDYDAQLAQLEKKFNESGNIVSKVFRATIEFVNGFRDGHFYLVVYNPQKYPNIFSTFVAVLPFQWDIIMQSDGKRSILISSNDASTDFLSSSQISIIENAYSKKVYVDTVDGKKAFDFFSGFFGDINEMKSVQGRLISAKAMAEGGFYPVEHPIDHLFTNHTLVFSDGTKLYFTLGFLNTKNRPKSRASAVEYGIKKLVEVVEPKTELGILEAIENHKQVVRSKRAEHVHVLCGKSKDGEMNYMSIRSFAPSNSTVYIQELVECIADFDNNDKPIAVIFPRNGGGSNYLRELTQYLLMPTSELRLVEAYRKSNRTEKIFINQGYYSSYIQPSVVTQSCSYMNKTTGIEWYAVDDTDDFGNGVVHVRTKKMLSSLRSSVRSYRNRCLKKHVRKPTEIIAVTDGLCFSACSLFVGACIRSGSAIVAGYGGTTPGDELFVAAQNPSSVIYAGSYNTTFRTYYNETGLLFATPFSETFNFSKKLNEKIPGDYDILRIDAHTGYYKALGYDLDDLLNHTKSVYERFKTHCNPANKRLFLVDENCTSDDPWALYSGHPCGSNGKWDMSKCKISACQPGWITDFDRNKCVRNACDPRDFAYNTSSYSDPDDPSSSSSSSSGHVEMSRASGLFPELAIFSSVIISLAIDFLVL